MSRGTLILVTGPSGAGKDTLIEGARAALGGAGRFAFPRREITRAADAGGESHRAIDEAEFLARRSAGRYALSWSAHGLHYGIPRAMEAELTHGRHVVANVSRTVIAEARSRHRPLAVIAVQVSAEALRARLQARARENEDEIERRLARADLQSLAGPDVVRFDNESPTDESIARFVALLDSLAAASANRLITAKG